MAAITIQGKGGNVTLPTGFNAKLDTWSASLDIKTTDITGFSDNGNRSVRPVLGSMSGSAGGTLITDSAPVATAALGATPDLSACKGTITLTAAAATSTSSTATSYYTFPALVTGVQMGRPNADKGTVTFNFQSRGAITRVWE